MRLLPLFGLASLVSASPTPPSGAREVVGVTRLVIYSHDNFQGTAHEMEATNRCVKLEAPVYKNLHSYGVVDQVCYFMDTDRCNGKVVVTADAQGTKVDVRKVEADAGRIAAVYCGKGAVNGREVKNVVGRREAKDFAGAREVTDFTGGREVNDFAGGREVKNVVGRREAKDFAGSREVKNVVGRREAKDFAGAREVIDFAGGREVNEFAGAREVKNIVGRREAKDFAGAREVTDFAGAREVRNVVGRREAKDFGGAREVKNVAGGREVNNVVGGREVIDIAGGRKDTKFAVKREKSDIIDDTPMALGEVTLTSDAMWTEDEPNSITSPTEKRTVSAKGDVRACKGNNCSWVKALNSCKAFSDNVSKEIDSLLQTAGSTCEYWEIKDCSRLVLTSISGTKDYHPNLGPGNEHGKHISAVSCKASRFAEASEDGQTIHASHDIEARSISTTPCDDPNVSRPNLKKDPGVLYFCANATNDPSLTKPEDCLNYRSCMSLQAMDKCVTLKQANHMFPMFDSLWQAKGAVCKYYKLSCKDRWPKLIIDSRNLDLPPTDYKKLPFGSAIVEAQCYHDTIAGDLGAGPDTIVVNSISSLRAAYGDDTSLEDSPSGDQAEETRKDSLSIAARDDSPLPIFTTTNGNTAAVPVDYPTNLIVCHDVNMGGKCLSYQGPGCAPNPFNVDAIESLKLPRGWRCAMYPYWNCSAEKGPPQYVEARDGEKVINDVQYPIWSITCIPLPFEE